MHDHPASPRAGATPDLPAGTSTPEQDMGQTRALLLEMALCQSLDQIFRLVAETFAARQDVALCRIWLLEQTEPCTAALKHGTGYGNAIVRHNIPSFSVMDL